MIVDTSAIVAIWRHEGTAEALSEALLQADQATMSAATYVELCCVLDDRAAPEKGRYLDDLLRSCGIVVVPFTPTQAQLARAAYRDFGKGSGHKAHLNLGDCFAYALASDTGDELLFVGDDFTYTDVTPAWLPSREN
jgi:ribonuclease VapC